MSSLTEISFCVPVSDHNPVSAFESSAGICKSLSAPDTPRTEVFKPVPTPSEKARPRPEKDRTARCSPSNARLEDLPRAPCPDKELLDRPRVNQQEAGVPSPDSTSDSSCEIDKPSRFLDVPAPFDGSKTIGFFMINCSRFEVPFGPPRIFFKNMGFTWNRSFSSSFHHKIV